MKMIGYVRVSTAEQAGSGAGLAVQEAAIREKAAREGWDLIIVSDAGISGSVAPDARPALSEALATIARGEADGIIVAKLDRLTRSLVDFAGLMETARKKGWSVVALDLGVDTSTPAGEMMANVLASFAQFERRLIGQRTREALAVKKAQGVILGRPKTVTAELTSRISALRAEGYRLTEIANVLNDENVPTVRGGRCWYASTVRAMLAA
jgi:DNA invertase Pin-like site-specific DNA recombinase